MSKEAIRAEINQLLDQFPEEALNQLLILLKQLMNQPMPDENGAETQA